MLDTVASELDRLRAEVERLGARLRESEREWMASIAENARLHARIARAARAYRQDGSFEKKARRALHEVGITHPVSERPPRYDARRLGELYLLLVNDAPIPSICTLDTVEFYRLSAEMADESAATGAPAIRKDVGRLIRKRTPVPPPPRSPDVALRTLCDYTGQSRRALWAMLHREIREMPMLRGRLPPRPRARAA